MLFRFMEQTEEFEAGVTSSTEEDVFLNIVGLFGKMIQQGFSTYLEMNRVT